MQKNILLSYTEYLKKEEKSPATAQKYLRAAEKFMDFLKNRELNRAEMLVYKEKLSKQYCAVSLNNVLCALNCFLAFLKREDLKL
ncbi:MAG: site-specific integrase, partial [Clostridia bacterium]|nr:site-specific integrase [Clostridia bacterium]